MFDWIYSHLAALGITSLIALAVTPFLKKKLPALAKKWSSAILSSLVNPDLADPEDKADVVIIMKAAMRISARRMKGRAGREKMEWVISYTCSRTALKRSDIEVIAQGVYESIAGELAAYGAEAPEK